MHTKKYFTELLYDVAINSHDAEDFYQIKLFPPFFFEKIQAFAWWKWNFLLVTRYFILVTRYFLLLTRSFLLVTRCFLLVTRSYLLVTHCYLLGTHYVLFVQCCIIFTIKYASVPEKENTSPNAYLSLVGRYCLPWCRFDCI